MMQMAAEAQSCVRGHALLDGGHAPGPLPSKCIEREVVIRIALFCRCTFSLLPPAVPRTALGVSPGHEKELIGMTYALIWLSGIW